MIKYSDIQNVFKSKNIDVQEYNIELEGSGEIATPFLVYTATDSDALCADGFNYIKFMNVKLAYIDEYYNQTMQNSIEEVFNETSIVFEKSIEYDEEMRLYSILYSFTVIDG